MTQELNIHNFLRSIQRHWLLIAAVAIVAAVATFAFTQLRPPSYTAQVILLVRAPQYQWRFDPSIQPIVDARRDWRRDFMLLAQANVVGERAAKELKNPFREEILRRVSTRTSGSDLIVLSASAQTPQNAADLANAWSRALQIEVANRYGTTLIPQNMDAPMKILNAELEQAQIALEKFKAETGQSVGSTQTFEAAGLEPTQKELDSKARLVADYNVAVDMLTRLQAQVAEVRAGQRNASDISWELLENGLLVKVPAFAPAQRPAPTDFAAWDTLLKRETAVLQESLKWLTEDAEKLQAQLASEDSQIYRLQQARNVAAEAVVAGLRKLNELKIQQTVDPIGVDILEPATPPTGTSSWPMGIRLLIAVVGGLIIGVWLALLWDFTIKRRNVATEIGNA